MWNFFTFFPSAAQVVQACISAAVFFTFMLQFYVPMDITWTNIKDRIPEEKHNLAQIIMRTTCVCFIVGVAAAAGHNLDALIDLVGALFLSTLGLVVPAILEIVVKWDNWGFLKWILVKDIILIIFGLFGTISGSYFAVSHFAKWHFEKFSKNPGYLSSTKYSFKSSVLGEVRLSKNEDTFIWNILW